MDYDKSDIAGVYDAARRLSPEGLEQWLGLLAKHVPADAPHIVDLGCGTGRFTQALADRFGARGHGHRPVAEDARPGAQASRLADRVTFMQAPGEALPLADGSADVVFMSMVLHHFADMEAVARECRRVLRAGGHVCIRSSTRETHFVHEEFFAGFRPLVDRVLPPRAPGHDRVRGGRTAAGRAAAGAGRAGPRLGDVRRQDRAARRLDHRAPGRQRLRGRHGKAAPAGASSSARPIVEELDWFVFRK